jgi:YfiH family protein
MRSNYNLEKTGVGWIIPEWPAPPNVKGLTTCRWVMDNSSKVLVNPPFIKGEISNQKTNYIDFNLGLQISDDPKQVLANREKLKAQAKLPSDPFWLTQVHGTKVIEVIDKENLDLKNDSLRSPEADASIAFHPNQVCAVLSADCLPVLFCDKAGTKVSAVHAGWRGLANGVLEAAVQKLDVNPQDLLVWLGPAIGPTAFEVKEDVLVAFKDSYNAACFKQTSAETWLADIYQLARCRLERLRITDIFGGGFCTYTENERFYSARRSAKMGDTKGRMASLIWLI